MTDPPSRPDDLPPQGGMQERLRATEARGRESDARFRTVFERSAIGIAVLDREGRLVEVNAALVAMLGYPSERLLGQRFAEITHPDDVAAGLALHHEQAAGTRDHYEIEKRFLRADGSVLWGRLVANAVRDPDGRMRYGVGMLEDITERVRAEAEMRRSESRYRSLVTATSQVVWTVDASGRAVDDLPAWRELTGQSIEDVRAGRWPEAVHPEDRERITDEVAQGFAAGRPFELEYRVRRPDGRYSHMEGRVVPVLDETGAVREWVGTNTDISERRVLEAQLLQAQKMEAVGRLAGGVAHDFNNLLTVITGYSDFIIAASGADDMRARDAEEIRRAAERAALLTQQLLAFSRKQVLRPEVLDLNATLRDVAKMLGRIIGEDVTLDLRLGSSVGAVLLDAGQLQQVLLNLAVNARDAMPGGGVLSIETADVVVEQEEPAQPSPLAPGRYARLAVRDSGTGMEPEVLSRAFEPFFTTKEAGKGTGLGLSTVYGIVTQSRGRLRVASEPGVGSAFEIFFPRVGRPEESEQAAAPAAPPRGSETILLIEDEATLRRLATKTLERLGYRVLPAGAAPEALRLGGEHPGPIDLVIVDVVLPGTPGPALVRRLDQVRGGLRVLYMSGYTEDTVTEHGLDEGRVSFLRKPFTPDQLARAVREVLDER